MFRKAEIEARRKLEEENQKRLDLEQAKEKVFIANFEVKITAHFSIPFEKMNESFL